MISKGEDFYVGDVVGDIVGSRFEFENCRRKEWK